MVGRKGGEETLQNHYTKHTDSLFSPASLSQENTIILNEISAGKKDTNNTTTNTNTTTTTTVVTIIMIIITMIMIIILTIIVIIIILIIKRGEEEKRTSKAISLLTQVRVSVSMS